MNMTQVLKKIGFCESYAIENKMQLNNDEDIFYVFEENNVF